MNAHLYVLTNEFKQLQIYKDTIDEYMLMSQNQISHIFISFDYQELLKRIKHFYTSIQNEGNKIILTHELSDKTSVIEVSDREIIVSDASANMLLPLLKRLYRNTILIEE